MQLTDGAVDGNGVPYTRLRRMQDAFAQVMATSPKLNVGLMRFHYSDGGPVVFPVTPVDETINEPLTVRVSASAGDAEERLLTGAVLTQDPVLKLGMVDGGPAGSSSAERTLQSSVNSAVSFTPGTGYQRDPRRIQLASSGGVFPITGLRFANLPADTRGASVSDARLRFVASGNFTTTPDILVTGHKVPDSPSFGSRRTTACQPNSRNPDPLCRLIISPTVLQPVEQISQVRDGTFFTVPVSAPLEELFNQPDYRPDSATEALTLILVGIGRGDAFAHGRRGPNFYRPTLAFDYVPATGSVPQPQRVALRFTDVRVPQGARISSAQVALTPVSDSADPVNLVLAFENAASAPELTEDRASLSRRTATTPVAWSIGSGTPWNAGETVTSPSIARALQMVVNRPDWCGGNDLVLLMDVASGTNGMRPVAAHDYVPGASSGQFPAPALSVELDPAQSYGAGQGCTVANSSIRVSDGADDARSNQRGNSFEDSTGYLDGDYGYFGTRFQGIPVPNAASIRRATLYMTSSRDADNGAGRGADYVIYGHASAASERFSSGSLAPGGRSRTRATETVRLPATPPVAGEESAVADVTRIVGEIVSYAGWRPGNAISLVASFQGGDSSYPEFLSVNQARGYAPRLEVVYRYNLGDTPGRGSGPLTVRDHLTRLVDDFAADGVTPLVDALYEALAYYRGGDVTWGLQRGNDGDPQFARRNTRVSHPLSYSGGTLVQLDGCNRNDPSAVGCETERIDGDPRYVSPISDPCQSNHIVLLTDGEANGNRSTALAQLLVGGSCRSTLLDASTLVNADQTCGLDLASFGNENDLSGVSGENTVTLHTIGFNFSGSFLRDLSVAGGGLFRQAASADDLAGVLGNLFESIRGSKAFAAPAVPADAFNRLFSGDHVYLSQFAPTLQRRWLGNVKKYEICQSSAEGTPGGACEVGTLIDASGRSATDNNGRISRTSQSLWRGASDPADGAEIDLGGIAGRLALKRPDRRVVYFDSAPQIALPDGGVTPDEGTSDDPELLRFADTDSGPAAGAETGTLDVLEGNSIVPGDAFRSTAQLLSMTATPPTAERRQAVRDQVNWIRGQDVDDEDGDGDTDEMRHAVGDPLHATPVAVTYSRINRTRADGSLDQHTVTKLFVASNDGGLRMVDAETGEEEWMFIPRELLGRQFAMREPRVGEHYYGLDSTPVVWSRDVDGDGTIEADDDDFVRLVFGMRRGGQSYYAIDVTPARPLTASGANVDGRPTITPTLLWRVNRADGELPHLGQTWSRPQIGRMLVGRESVGTHDKAEVRDVVFVGGGYDPIQDDSFAASGDGNAIYLLDAKTGKRLFWVSGDFSTAAHRRATDAGTLRGVEAPGMEFSIPSDLRLLDTDNDRLIDRILVGDTGGQVWRVDLRAKRGRNDGVEGVVARLASLAFSKRTTAPGLRTLSVDDIDQPRFFSPPERVRVRGDNLYSRTSDYDLIVIGSGTRPNPLDTGTQDYLFILRDLHPGSLFSSDIDGNGLLDEFIDGEVPGLRLGDSDQTIGNTRDDLLSVSPLSDGTRVGVTPRSAQLAKGLRIALAESGEKALSIPLVIGGKVLFTTYVPGATPDGDSCTGAEGGGRLHTINLITGATAYDTQTLGPGIPSSPALFFRNLNVPGGEGDPDTGILVGTGGGSILIAPPNLLEPIDTLPGSNRGVNRRRSQKWDRLEYGVYWFENPD